MMMARPTNIGNVPIASKTATINPHAVMVIGFVNMARTEV